MRRNNEDARSDVCDAVCPWLVSLASNRTVRVPTEQLTILLSTVSGGEGMEGEEEWGAKIQERRIYMHQAASAEAGASALIACHTAGANRSRLGG